MIHVGIDEAGYGPTLGPLVISAAAFREEAPQSGIEHFEKDTPVFSLDLWELLAGVVTRKPDRTHIPVNDSKKLYKPGKGPGKPLVILR